jgi:hypothetical protein
MLCTYRRQRRPAHSHDRLHRAFAGAAAIVGTIVATISETISGAVGTTTCD